MAKAENLQFILLVAILSISYTNASPLASLLSDSNKKSESYYYAPLDDEDKDNFSGDPGNSFNFPTYRDENASKEIEEVVVYFPEDNDSMNLKDMNVQEYFDRDLKMPAGLQASYGGYDDLDDGDYKFDYGCGVLESLGIYCPDEPPTEQEDTTTAETGNETTNIITTTENEQETATSTTIEPSSTTTTITPAPTPAEVTTTSAASTSTRNRQPVPETEKTASASTSTTSTAITLTEGDEFDVAKVVTTRKPQKAGELATTTDDQAEEDEFDVFVPPIMPVTSQTGDELTTSRQVRGVETTTKSTENVKEGEEKETGTQVTPETTIQNTIPPTAKSGEKQSTTTRSGMTTTTEEDKRYSKGTDDPKKRTTTKTEASDSEAATHYEEEASVTLLTTAKSPETTTTLRAAITTASTMAKIATITPKVDADLATVIGSVESGNVITSVPPETTRPQFQTTAELSVEKETVRQPKPEVDGEDEFDINKPSTTSKSDEHQGVTQEIIAPQKAEFTTAVLIICIVSLFIVLILAMIIVLIVRARLKRRGKYAITSEVDSTEGAAGGQAGDVATGSPAKVVTVQYNDSNA